MSKVLYSVGGLVKYIKGILDTQQNLQGILVKGEISNFTNHRSGHWYFTLKDAKAKINCVMFSSYASRCKVMPKEGMKVIINASVSMYEASGSTQLYVTGLQPDGIGELYLQLEAVKEKMRMQGCFSQELKKPLPDYPMRIALITAKTGAAVQDILTTISRRWPICEVSVYPSLVQGVSAADHIIENLQKADQEHHDVILLARGGGAIEDLWCFNEEKVARAILSVHTVVVTGIGHETDTTLIDYVSDARAPTPTAAAELITPDILDVSFQLKQIRRKMFQRMNFMLQLQRQKLDQLQNSRYMQDPVSYIQREQMTLALHIKQLGNVDKITMQQRKQLHESNYALALAAQRMYTSYNYTLSTYKERLNQAIQQMQEQKQQLLLARAALLDAFSPLKILQRGYAIAYHQHKALISAKDVKEQELIEIRLHEGTLQAIVQSKEETS